MAKTRAAAVSAARAATAAKTLAASLKAPRPLVRCASLARLGAPPVTRPPIARVPLRLPTQAGQKNKTDGTTCYTGSARAKAYVKRMNVAARRAARRSTAAASMPLSSHMPAYAAADDDDADFAAPRERARRPARPPGAFSVRASARGARARPTSLAFGRQGNRSPSPFSP